MHQYVPRRKTMRTHYVLPAALLALASLISPVYAQGGIVFHAEATGTLRTAFGVADGTPGTVTSCKRSNIVRSNVQAAVVNLRATGK
jgi:hypothetical protein